MKAEIVRIDSIEPVGENLSRVLVEDKTVVANRKEDGSFRWAAEESAVYLHENAIVPRDVLEERGYWAEGAKKGDLGGSKGNRVKMRAFTIGLDGEGEKIVIESRGLLFKLEKGLGDDGKETLLLLRGSNTLIVQLGDDVTDFLGVTEYKAS